MPEEPGGRPWVGADGTPSLPPLTEEQYAARRGPAPRSRRRRPASGGRSVGPRLARRIIGAAAAATILVSSAILVLHLAGDQDAESITSTTSTVPLERADPAPAERPSAPRPRPQRIVGGSRLTVLRVSEVQARPGRGSLTLWVATTRRSRLRISLHGADSALGRRLLHAGPGPVRIRFTGLPPGPLRWRVQAPGESATSGHLRILAPPSAPRPDPVTQPAAPVGPQAPAPGPAHPVRPSGKPAPPAPSPKKPGQRKPGHKPRSGPRPQGPPPAPHDPDHPHPGPYDPDDG